VVSQRSIVFEQLCGALQATPQLPSEVRRSVPRSGAVLGGDDRGRLDCLRPEFFTPTLTNLRRHDFERWVAYGRAEELALFVRHLQEPARPAPWIAANRRTCMPRRARARDQSGEARFLRGRRATISWMPWPYLNGARSQVCWNPHHNSERQVWRGRKSDKRSIQYA